jgi:hypothetical protein
MQPRDGSGYRRSEARCPGDDSMATRLGSVGAHGLRTASTRFGVG